MSDLLPLGLKLHNTLKAHNIFHTLLNKATEIVKHIPSYEDLKDDPELLLLIVNIVENIMRKNKYGIDKKDLVLCIYDNLFSLTEEEKTTLEKQIQFLHDNKKIQKVPLLRIVWSYLKKCVRNFLEV